MIQILKYYLIFLIVISLQIITSQPSYSKKIALVIGNDNYLNVGKLKKAVNDATAIAKTLKFIGFRTTLKTNVDRQSFSTLLGDMSSIIQKGDEVVFYFSGHGVEAGGDNYVLPIDIPKFVPRLKKSISKEAFSETEILNYLKEAGAKVSILIIDACRDNPFPKSRTKSVGSLVGLGRPKDPPAGTFIMYSAGIGQKALDRLSENDEDRNSVFTRKLLPLLKQPGLEISQIIKTLRIEVRDLALKAEPPNQGHKQFPAYYDEMESDFYFVLPPKNKLSSGKYKTKPLENEKPQKIKIKKHKLAKNIKDYQKQVEYILHTYKPHYLKGLNYSFQGCKTKMQYVDISGRYKMYYAFSFTYDELRGDIELEKGRDSVELRLPIIGESKTIIDFRSAGKRDSGWNSGVPIFMLERENRKFNTLMFSLSKACAQYSLNTSTMDELWFPDEKSDFF